MHLGTHAVIYHIPPKMRHLGLCIIIYIDVYYISDVQETHLVVHSFATSPQTAEGLVLAANTYDIEIIDTSLS